MKLKYDRLQRRVHIDDSSSVLSLFYDRDMRVLEVQYLNGPGHIYAYQDVPKSIFIDCVQDVSVGGFINRVVKPNFEFIKVVCL